jgi:hypothetical protein
VSDKLFFILKPELFLHLIGLIDEITHFPFKLLLDLVTLGEFADDTKIFRFFLPLSPNIINEIAHAVNVIG